MPLRITSVQLFTAEIPLRLKIEHALAARHANTTGFLLLTAEDGTWGVGEFLSREYVMGETRDEIVHYLRSVSPRLLSAEIARPLDFIRALWSEPTQYPGRFGGIGVLDLALLDLWGKQCGKPVAALLAAVPSQWNRDIAFSAVYPFASGLKLAALNLGYARLLHISDLKVKGSGDLARDLAFLSRIRQAFPYPVQIRLDLNSSLTPDNAPAYFERMLESGVAWFEQPFPKNAWAESARFQKQYAHDAVLCADESVCSIGDLERTIREGAFKAVNIRIGKNGGLVASLELYERAVAAGLQVQLGALVGETSVLAFAGLQFAAAVAPLAHYEGCFGRYLVKRDPLKPSLTFGRFGRVPLKCLPPSGMVPPFELKRLEALAFSKEHLE